MLMTFRCTNHDANTGVEANVLPVMMAKYEGVYTKLKHLEATTVNKKDRCFGSAASDNNR